MWKAESFAAGFDVRHNWVWTPAPQLPDCKNLGQCHLPIFSLSCGEINEMGVNYFASRATSGISEESKTVTA